MTATEVLDQFRAHYGNGPIKLLGQGANGAAIMIGDNVYKFWMQDSAYTAFVQYCLTNPNNPFLPHFKSNIKKIPAFFIRHENAPDYVNFIKMEKLAPYRTDYWFEMNMEIDTTEDEDEYVPSSFKLNAVDYALRNLKDGENPLEGVVRSFSKLESHQYTVEDLGKDLILYINTYQAIKNLGFNMDLHDENFMVRSGGQLVILDPITSKADLDLNMMFYKFDQKLFRDDNEGKPAIMSKTANKSIPKSRQDDSHDDTTMDQLDDFMKNKGNQHS